MAWARLDDGFFDHPKARAAGRDGRALFMAGLCWSAGHLTDGFIAITDLSLVAAKAEVKAAATARRLVNVKLWEVTIDGWLIHDYSDFNPSAEAVLAVRHQRAQAGRKGGRTSRPPRSKSEANGEANGQPKPEANGKRNGTPYPYPLNKEQSRVSEAQQIRMRKNQEHQAAEAAAWVPPTDEERRQALEELHQARAAMRSDHGEPDIEPEPTQ